MTMTPFRYGMDEAISSEIRAAILHSRMPLAALARAAGMSPRAVCRTMIGSAALSVGELGAIAGALGTTGAELMERAEQSLADRRTVRHLHDPRGLADRTRPPAGQEGRGGASVTAQVAAGPCSRHPSPCAVMARPPDDSWDGAP